MSAELPEEGAGEERPSGEPSAEWVTIGEVVGPFGHKGEIKVYPYTDFPERFTSLKSALLRLPDGVERKYQVRRARQHKNIIVMALYGVMSMDDAEALRGSTFVVPPEERHPLPDDQTFYVDDLVGLRVQTEDGEPLGTIRQVLKSPANDVYDLGHLLIPAIKDVVVRVDLTAGLMVIRPIPGLLDEPETA